MTFAALLAQPGVEETFRRGERIGLMAFHGGLEAMTDVIATTVADATGASLYVVRQPPDLRWHIPSVDVDPAASPKLAAFLDHVDTAIALHGYGREGFWTTLLLGGRHRTLAHQLAKTLRTAVAPQGYDVVDDLDAIPQGLRGLHQRNPVNRARHGGVQLELPPRIRGTSPLSRPEHTHALLTGLTDAVKTQTQPRRAARSSLRQTRRSPDHVSSTAHTLLSTNPSGRNTSRSTSSVMSVGHLRRLLRPRDPQPAVDVEHLQQAPGCALELAPGRVERHAHVRRARRPRPHGHPVGQPSSVVSKPVGRAEQRDDVPGLMPSFFASGVPE